MTLDIKDVKGQLLRIRGRMVRKFLTSKEAADYLGIQEAELQEIADKRKIPTYRIGGIYARFKVDDLDSYGRKTLRRPGHKKYSSTFPDRIKDFFYFNDFYILSSVAIVIILYFIFK